MADARFVEKQKILKLINAIPYDTEDKQKWQAVLEENDVDEALLTELHEKLMQLPTDKFSSDWIKVRDSTELKKFIEDWRMRNASKKFRHNR